MKTSKLGVIDTNILVFAADTDSDFHTQSKDFLLQLSSEHFARFTPQIFLESYNVLVGLGWNGQEVRNYLLLIGSNEPNRLLYPTNYTHQKAIEKAVEDKVCAKRRIFDYFLAQTMLDNGIHRIYTQNTNDFKQFSKIEAINPLA